MDILAQPLDLDAALKAVSHPVRRSILQWLKDPEGNFPGQEHPHSLGVCAGQIDARDRSQFGGSAGTYRSAPGAGLITGRRGGQWVFFKRDEAAIRRFLDQIGTAL
jgi:ArsR family transcriptional regulator